MGGANKGSLKVTRAEVDKRRALMAAMATPVAQKLVKRKPAMADKIHDDTNQHDHIGDVSCLNAVPAPSDPMVTVLGKLRHRDSELQVDSQRQRDQCAREARTLASIQVRAIPEDPSWCMVDWSGSGTFG